jgi:hypothetical protein
MASTPMSLNDDCIYKTYTNPQLLTETETNKDRPRCGFNVLGSAYCPVRKGDTYFKEFLKMMKEVLVFQNKLLCNVGSNGQCKSLLDRISSKTKWNAYTYRIPYLIDNQGGNA